MKKAFGIFIIMIALFLSGCGGKQQTQSENKIPNPVEDPGGYIPGMIDVNKKAHEDIQNAVNAENERLKNSLNESGLNDGPNK